MCRACHDDALLRMDCQERVPEYLRGIHLFRGLAEERIQVVADGAESIHLKGGQWLFERGEEAERFFVVRKGEMALFRQNPEGRETILALVGEDEVFAEELLLFESPRHDLFARAVKPCTVLAIDRRNMRGLLEREPKLWGRLALTLHRRQQMLLDHIERLTLHDATQRLMAYLLERVGDAEGPQRFKLSVTKTVLASHLSIQPETLSRILGRLKECQVVKEEGDSLVLLDTDELRRAVHCVPCPVRSWGCPGPESRPEATAAVRLVS